MRKYIQARRPVHMKDFQVAYKVIQVSKCFIATELVCYTHIDTIPALRGFRDQVLKKKRVGRKFVAWYYMKGPRMAAYLSETSEPVKVVAGKAIDLLARVVTIY